MNYDETFEKRSKLIIKADSITEQYLELATEILNKSGQFGKYSSIIHENIEDDGISFELWLDQCDYTAGRGSYFVSKQLLDMKIEQFLRRKKLNKLNKL